MVHIKIACPKIDDYSLFINGKRVKLTKTVNEDNIILDADSDVNLGKVCLFKLRRKCKKVLLYIFNNLFAILGYRSNAGLYEGLYNPENRIQLVVANPLLLEVAAFELNVNENRGIRENIIKIEKDFMLINKKGKFLNIQQ